MSIKIGCCGFQEARSKYYNEFPLVEIQQTFFQPPPVGTAFKWRSQAPQQFEFSVKAWQLITHEAIGTAYRNIREKLTARAIASCGHFKPTRMVFDAWRRTEAVADALKASIIVFQTQKTFRPTHDNIKNFRNFFRRINRQKYQIVWEPDVRWPLDTIQGLCKELNLIYTSEPLKNNFTNIGPIQYCRLRGKKGFRSRYDEEDFQKLLQIDQNGTPTYFIFNNSSMLFDARNFVHLIQNKAETDQELPEKPNTRHTEPESGHHNTEPQTTGEKIATETENNGHQTGKQSVHVPNEAPAPGATKETIPDAN